MFKKEKFSPTPTDLPCCSSSAMFINKSNILDLWLFLFESAHRTVFWTKLYPLLCVTMLLDLSLIGPHTFHPTFNLKFFFFLILLRLQTGPGKIQAFSNTMDPSYSHCDVFQFNICHWWITVLFLPCFKVINSSIKVTNKMFFSPMSALFLELYK